jgi:hypothetical protein
VKGKTKGTGRRKRRRRRKWGDSVLLCAVSAFSASLR